jgi:hypothetical protein
VGRIERTKKERVTSTFFSYHMSRPARPKLGPIIILTSRYTKLTQLKNSITDARDTWPINDDAFECLHGKSEVKHITHSESVIPVDGKILSGVYAAFHAY